ncbi:DUF3726 domain-containing protein [Octadecabacter sp. R77987]|uniref:DUF3726 domain-containing protein n=1 Tax=Octadecabacter sp. R77987 TaxID=3093874 RepID=UPI0036710353
MMRSLNEVQGLVLKAARGAGVPLGHAEDIAAAMPDYIALGGDMGALAAALDCPHTAWTDGHGCAVMAGPTAIDLVRAGQGEQRINGADLPLLFVGLVSMANRFGAGLACDVQDDCVVIAVGQGATVTLAIGPVTVEGAAWAALMKLAARTFVPETETSRAAGAGAGLTDND